ncbi:hypothetical protein J6590_005889 [Homalodisca vitripennis]|nr:hypothetical protein J6590_005889 [Homalodisca vitripennis]
MLASWIYYPLHSRGRAKSWSKQVPRLPGYRLAPVHVRLQLEICWRVGYTILCTAEGGPNRGVNSRGRAKSWSKQVPRLPGYRLAPVHVRLQLEICWRVGYTILCTAEGGPNRGVNRFRDSRVIV